MALSSCHNNAGARGPLSPWLQKGMHSQASERQGFAYIGFCIIQSRTSHFMATEVTQRVGATGPAVVLRTTTPGSHKVVGATPARLGAVLRDGCRSGARNRSAHRGTESAHASREQEGERISSRLWAEHGARHRARSHHPRITHDLNGNQESDIYLAEPLGRPSKKKFLIQVSTFSLEPNGGLELMTLSLRPELRSRVRWILADEMTIIWNISGLPG